MVKLTTTSNGRAFMASCHERYLEGTRDLVKDFNIVLDALIAEKRAHAEHLEQLTKGNGVDELRAEADALEKV